MKNKKTIMTLWVLASIFWQTIPAHAQQKNTQITDILRETINEDAEQFYKNFLLQTRGGESFELFERIFGDEAENAVTALDENASELFEAVNGATSGRSAERLEEEITKRSEKRSTNIIITPNVKTKPSVKSKKQSFNFQPALNWRQFAFGFQPLARADEKPDIKMTETDKEIKAEGQTTKNFETKEAKGTRTQKAETRYTKDGKTFGVEIRNTQIIEAVSKPDGKSFRQEISMVWGAQVAACPDVNGVSKGTGAAKVVSKTIYTEGGATVTMVSDFDLQATLVGSVSDEANLKNYDMQVDAYLTNSGFDGAFERKLIKEIKVRDGRYGIRLDIPGNTIEVSDGKYGGNRTPAKMGKVSGSALTPLPDEEKVGSAIGSMVPTIWNSANEMYKTAERNWKNYGCVEVVCKVPKTTLEAGEEITISAETVHLQDGGKVNTQMTAEAYQGQISPELQAAKPGATFNFTQEGDENSYFSVQSVSKRGIGKGEVDFTVKKEKEEKTEAGIWTGTIKAERKQREEKEKRSGANLAENGGYMETTTNVQFQLTGRLDRSVEATNAYIANVTGSQQTVDFEYDRYKIDEGYCGPNAVPFKGPKEITRTSTTTANYNKETRVFVEIGGSGGTLTFSLPEINGTTVHKYVHKSPCPDHDRTNTNEAINEDTPTAGGSFSVSFPVDASQKTIKGSITVQETDGGTTVYSWELTRR